MGEPPEHRDWHIGDEYSRPEIHPTASIGALCTIDGGMIYTEPGRVSYTTCVGARSFLMKRCHVGHNTWIGQDCELGAGVVVCGEVVIGDRVRIGGNAWIRPLVKIGDGARIGGGSVVVKDVPAGEVWAGNPAKPLKTGREVKARGQLPPVTHGCPTHGGLQPGPCPICGWEPSVDHDSHFHMPVTA